MMRRILAACTATAFAVASAGAQTAKSATLPERAIRRDIPVTDMIRRAYAAGTRDTAGTPGPHYWQLWMDYTIDARFDSATESISGVETAVIHNNSDSAMHDIVLRLDQNLFAANVPRAEVVTDITPGMQVTKLTVDGAPVDLEPPPPVRRQRGQPAAPPAELLVRGVDQTSARIELPNPVPAHGTATIGAEWHFKVPKVVSPTRGIRMGRWADTLYQVAPVVSARRRVRRSAPAVGHRSVPRSVGVLQQLRPLRRAASTCRPDGSSAPRACCRIPTEVLTPTERERLAHVLGIGHAAAPSSASPSAGPGNPRPARRAAVSSGTSSPTR